MKELRAAIPLYCRQSRTHNVNRFPGVTVSAVVAIVGSLGVALLGAFAALGAVSLAFGRGLPPEATAAPRIPVAMILGIEAFVALGFGIFGIVAAVGLLRLRNWARISFLVFAGLLAFFSGSSILGGIMGMVAMQQIAPPNPNVPAGFMSVIFTILIIMALLLGALATCWLIYFSRRTVKAQFVGEAAAALPRRGPLSITIIAWMLVVSSFFVLPGSLSRYPALLLGLVVGGWFGRVVYLLWGHTHL